MSLSNCKYNLRRYIKIRNKLEYIIKNLDEFIKNSNYTKNEIKFKYQLNDDVPPIYDQIGELNDNVSSTKNYLNNKILPSVNYEIYRLRNEISKLENELTQTGD